MRQLKFNTYFIGYFLTALIMILTTGCHSSSEAGKATSRVPTPTPMPSIPGLRGGQSYMPSPDVCIYRMKKDYSHNVPITMNAERTEIISYPAPSDLISGGKLCLPDSLHKGYWLDNRGINKNSVFLDYTYEEYASMPKAPSLEELMTHIIDKNPFTEIVTCGPRRDYKDIIKELNDMIDNGVPGNQLIVSPRR